MSATQTIVPRACKARHEAAKKVLRGFLQLHAIPVNS